MKCMGNFIDDRTCEVCKLADEKTYWKCFEIHTKMKALNNKLYEIEEKCPHRDFRYDHRDKYYICKINKNNDCNVTLDCEKHVM